MTIKSIIRVPLFLAIFLNGCSENKSDANTNDSNLRMEFLGETLVKSKLKDPDSATFRNQIIGREGNPCGEVNSKNGFGGFTGYKRYIVASKDLIVFEGENIESSEFEESWKIICAR